MLYMIYKVCGDNGDPLQEPFLYAMTDEKELYKKFVQERNMDLFEITKKDLSPDEEESFYKHHSSYYLKEYLYPDGNGNSYKIVSSLQEYSTTIHSDNEVAYEISRSFKKSYYNLLSDTMKGYMKDMLYEDILAYVNFVDAYYMSSDMMMSEGKPRFDTSTFRVFLYMYGNTLHIKG
nr:MAG TPA: hypothetical protein [Caudoviricetes sp.]